ncbi:MAG: tetratricopeptide repeat protein, partial [Paludibacteraceae bacterium]|nr:tetratricopeptide repeat protein [Paludibacteraceae bacterium]
MRKIFVFFFALLSLSVYSQSADKAAKLFSEGAYQEAQAVYAQLLKKSPKNQLYLYRYARCADELGQKDAAIEYFEKAGDKYALRNYYLGLLYADAYRFSEAVGCLEAYILTIDAAHANYEVADSVL